MKKVLLVIASLLVVSSVMAAMAFTSASVPIESQASIISTDRALLAVTGNKDHAAVKYAQQDVGGETIESLHFNFDQGVEGSLGKGANNDEYGMQPGSEYTWNNLFKVRNNSENDVTATINFAPSETGENDLHPGNLEIREMGGSESDWVQIDGSSNSLEVALGTGSEARFDVRFTFPEINFGDGTIDEANEVYSTDTLEKFFDIVVNAEAEVGENYGIDAGLDPEPIDPNNQND